MRVTKSRNAFTMVELLVAISIVGVLAALLTVGVKKVSQNSQRVSCASNMRQVGVAIMLYAGEKDGQLPYCFGGSVGPQKVDGVATSWNLSKVANDLSSYVDDKIWDCPDPMVRANRKTSAAFGIVWTKSTSSEKKDPLTSNWVPGFEKAHRLLEYEKPTTVPLFYCSYCSASQGPGTPGNRPWPHGRTINQLYLDGHVQSYRPTWPDG